MTGYRTRILVVDDDADMREILKARLQEWGFKVRLASGGVEAEKLVKSYDPDIVVTDVVVPDVSGLELLRNLKAGDAARPLLLMTGHASVDMAVEAMKQGAVDYVTKPLDFSQLRSILDTVGRDVSLRRRSERLTSRLEKGAGFGPFVGVSKRMRKVYDLIKSLGGSDASAIITGESGTGKEIAAQTIHELSARVEGPFIAVNAAAIPENLMENEIFGHEKGAFTGATAVRKGCFELANGGTLFLDEIAEMPLALQPKLLRILEDGRVRRLGGRREFTVDVRVLAATNQNPRRALKDRRLREDLYYRLNVFTVRMPPLRDRKSDIPLLVYHFVKEFNRKHNAGVKALRDEALEMLKNYSWPGNVRELRNVVERAVILAKGSWIEPSHLPSYIQNPNGTEDKIVLPIGITVAEAEKELILKTLEKTGNNKLEAARQLGLNVKTIRNKLKRYGIDS